MTQRPVLYVLGSNRWVDTELRRGSVEDPTLISLLGGFYPSSRDAQQSTYEAIPSF